MRTEMSRWDESQWQIRKVGYPDSGNVKEVCGAGTTPSPSTPDEIDRPDLSLSCLNGFVQRPTVRARACSIRMYKGSSFEGTCLRNSLSALTVANAWTGCPFPSM